MPRQRSVLRALRFAVAGFATNGLFVYNVASGTALLLHLLKIMRRRGGSIGLRDLVGEGSLRFRVPAARAALFVAAFTLLYRLGLEAGRRRVRDAAAASAAGDADADSDSDTDTDGGSTSTARRAGIAPSAQGRRESTSSTDALSAADDSVSRPAPPRATTTILPLAVALSSAGAAAVASLALSRSTRSSLALYSFTRALHVLWRAGRDRGLLAAAVPSPLAEAVWQQLAMALCGGFVMYAYVMRPEALDPSLRRFMVKTAPIDPVALRATAAVARADPVHAEEVGRFVAAVNPQWRRQWGADAPYPSGWPADMGPPGEAGMTWGRWLQLLRQQAWSAINPFSVARPGKLSELRRWLGPRVASGGSGSAGGGAPYLASRHGAAAAAAVATAGTVDAWGSPAQVVSAGGAALADSPSLLLRPQQPVALLHWLETFSSSVRSTFPLYVVLGAVPSAAFNPRALVQRPLGWAWGVLATAARSAGFISSFVTVYMASVDVYNRYVSPRLAKGPARSPRALYFVAGMVACATTVLERPSRRGELLLYCFARALEILAAILAARGWRGVPGWDSALLAASVAVLVYAHRFERTLLTSLPRTVLDSLLGVPGS